MQDRYYQSDAVDSTIDLLNENPEAHPLVVMPTGSGKSHTICLLVDDILTNNPNRNILVLSHVKEILMQDHDALENYFEGVEIGLYSAGLDSRTVKKITVAGIQSIYSKQEEFCQFDIIIIDECHLIPMDDESMYRTFLNWFEGKATYIGFTATHFRMGHGYIHKGDGALFTDISYDLSERDAFNRLIEEGYLSKLVIKPTKNEFDVEGLKITAGEYNIKAMTDRFDRKSITDNAIDEIIRCGKNLNQWLVFAIDIDHAEHIAETLRNSGIKTACIHSKMEGDRGEVLADVKAGEYRAVVNVDILTTGFDSPLIDLIAFLRPTQSPVLHVQMTGRGLRVIYKLGFILDSIEGRLAAIEAGPKQACLILDFAGNTRRLGPINDINIIQKGKSDEVGEAITKDCPECGAINHPSNKLCDNCGHEFIFIEKLSSLSDNAVIVRDNTNMKEWLDVSDVKYSIHSKPGKPSSLRVTYRVGLVSFSEWICYDHKGYAGRKASHWVKWRWIGYKDKLPANLSDLYANSDLLRKPKKILVNNVGKFPSIEDSIF